MAQAQAPDPELEYPPTNAWETPLVATVCTIIILFCYYRVLKPLCFAHRGLTISRNRVGRRRLNEANPVDPSLQSHSQALESSLLNSLPISQFKKKNEGEDTQINTDCAVCLGEFEEGQWLKHLPNCTHAFHVPCIDTWFQSHSNCPICRSHVYDLAIHRESSVSLQTMLETLRREDFFHERTAHYQNLRSTILANSGPRHESPDSS